MKTFKQKALLSAIAGAGALVAAGAANAVYVNQDGLGQALVYPYYTVRNDNITAISVVNTTEFVKAVKVRFIEGKNSKEVLDFNLFLSPYDVWTAGVVANASGASVVTTDKSCTNPPIPAAGQPFRNAEYLPDADNSLDRTREGYVEILEMAYTSTTTTIGKAVTHNNGVPACTTSVINNTGILTNRDDFADDLNGGLFGAGTVINFNAATAAGYDAVAFDGWSTFPQVTASGSTSPNLGGGDSLVSVVNDAGKLYVGQWTNGRDAVSATIMHSNIVGEYAYTTDGVVGTEWVVTLPTKNLYVGTGTAQRPFAQGWSRTTNRSCDPVGLHSYDREERTEVLDDDFSPQIPGETNSLCWEANVITFGGSVNNSLGSTNVANINPIQAPGGAADPALAGGWLDLSFTSTDAYLVSQPASTVTDTTVPVTAAGVAGEQTYGGLPTVGFIVSTTRYDAGSPLKNYSSTYQLKFKRSIQ